MKHRILNRVKEYRVRMGLTQSDLAAQAGVSRQSIISIEKGQYIPSLPLALTLARIFEIQTDTLFYMEEKSNAG